MESEELEKQGIDQDKELVEMAQAGELASYAKLIDKYNRKMYYLALNIVNDAHDAQDLAQTAFVKAWQGINSFQGKSSFQTWLIQILINLCNSHLKHKNIVLSHILPFFELKKDDTEDSREPGIITNIADKSVDGSPEDKLIQELLGKSINNAISGLPHREREVFILKHINGLKIREIAGLLGIAEGSVKAHMFKAVRKLQGKLHGYEM